MQGGRRLLARYGAVVWLVLLAGTGALFLGTSGLELREALAALSGAEPRWMAAAALTQGAILLAIAEKKRLLLARLGAPLGRGLVAWVHLRRFFVATVVPFGGPVGHASVVRDLGRRGVGAGTALYGSVLANIVDDIAAALFLLPALLWLVIAGEATLPMVAGAAMLGPALVVGPGGLLLMHRGEGLPGWVGRVVPARVAGALADLRGHGLRPGDLLRATPYALAVNALGVGMLAAALWAVGADPSPTTLLAARVAASATVLVLPVFGGLGAVEVAVAGVLAAGGVGMPEAVAGTVVFRAAQFWLPLGLGAGAHLPLRRPRVAMPAMEWAMPRVGIRRVPVMMAVPVVVEQGVAPGLAERA